jgi:hypothetical protein
MAGGKRKRSPEIRFVVSAEEYQFIRAQCSASGSGSINTYARAVLLKKPVVIKIRNQSAEDLLEAMIAVKKELEALREGFAAAPGHSLEILCTRMEAIRLLMQQYYERCTQPST